MSDQDEDKIKVLLPMIRKIMPKLIAEDIVGVQPMTGHTTIQTGMTQDIEFPYWVELPYSPGMIFNLKNPSASTPRYQEYYDWCEQTFKAQDWNKVHDRYYFRYEKDRDWFVIKWG